MQLRFRTPAEWEKHEAVWSAWPANEDEWGSLLPAVELELGAFFRSILDSGRGERLNLLVAKPKVEAARDALTGLNVVLFEGAPYGDIWLRDTAPLFTIRGEQLGSVRFRFDGWGGKFRMPGDDQVASFIQEQVPSHHRSETFVLEGGALETDGEGTLLTTRSCLLDPVRNPGVDRAVAEEVLRRALGFEKTLWLDGGLHNDHTDGHVDNLVRFLEPGKLVCMHPSGVSDPNRDTLLSIRAALETMTDARGRRFEVATIPSPGEVTAEGGGASADGGDVLSASYMNYYVTNTRVIVPTFGVAEDAAAVAGLAALWPSREVVGCPARALVEGGGSFHCITQQQPQVPGEGGRWCLES